MPISELLWPEDRVEHIAQHGVRPEEVEEACFGRTLVLRAKATGENPVYYVLGRPIRVVTCSALSSSFPGAGDIP